MAKIPGDGFESHKIKHICFIEMVLINSGWEMFYDLRVKRTKCIHPENEMSSEKLPLNLIKGTVLFIDSEEKCITS